MQDVIRMTYDVALCHPDEITKIWSLSHPDDLAIPSISSGWLIVDALCHPDDLPGVGISSGWVTANSLCHPDDILFQFMSSGWINWGWFLIRMIYGNVIMSSGWDTLPFLSHPDEIANFDFPQHAVALQRFRSYTRYLKRVFPSRWFKGSKFFFRGGYVQVHSIAVLLLNTCYSHVLIKMWSIILSYSKHPCRTFGLIQWQWQWNKLYCQLNKSQVQMYCEKTI